MGITAALVCAIVAAVTLRHALLNFMAAPLFYTDEPARADILYILGGDYETRGTLAAHLLHQRWAPQIVFSRESNDPSLPENQTDLLVMTLKREGVDDRQMTELRPPGGVNSTAMEMRELRRYAASHSMNRVLIVTSSFHGRRARMAARRAMRGTGIDIRVVTADSRFAAPDGWQDNPVGRLQVRLEMVKMLYYFFTFF